MPYVNIERRVLLDQGLARPRTAGELNYVITSTILRWLEGVNTDRSYSDLNEVIGVLECAKLELYRRLLVKYEKAKIQENGDLAGFQH